MSESTETSCFLPFTAGSSLAKGLHVSAALGGGPAHAFRLDTGSVGIVVPRAILGADYQDFDPSQDIAFGYVSSGNTYLGQWVRVPAVLGVPADWDGTGDFPEAFVDVFAVGQPAGFNGGVFGIGFGIGGAADGGPARNPLLHVQYLGARLSQGYVISKQGVDIGLTAANTEGFSFVALESDPSGEDWLQPFGSIALTMAATAEVWNAHLPILMDTGISQMIIWTSRDNAPPNIASNMPFPAGISIAVNVPPAAPGIAQVLQYSFVTADASQPMAPAWVEWRIGHGINTGINVLAGADYLYDHTSGRIGFRLCAPQRV